MKGLFLLALVELIAQYHSLFACMVDTLQDVPIFFTVNMFTCLFYFPCQLNTGPF